MNDSVADIAPAYPPAFAPTLPAEALLAAATAQTGLSAVDLASRFESFGNDCEFGWLQRKCGAEPFGLFRWSNPEHEVILRAVTTIFEGFGDASYVELDSQRPREWTAVDPVNTLREHLFLKEGEQPEAAMRRMHETRRFMLRRMMIKNIREGNKIFVIKSGQGRLSRDIVLPIAQALRRSGPGWLLWVEAGPEVGRVEILADGLLHGTIDRLTVQPNASLCSLPGWLAVLTAAWLIVQNQAVRRRTA
jgi:hypothetical protein